MNSESRQKARDYWARYAAEGDGYAYWVLYGSGEPAEHVLACENSRDAFRRLLEGIAQRQDAGEIENVVVGAALAGDLDRCGNIYVRRADSSGKALSDLAWQALCKMIESPEDP